MWWRAAVQQPAEIARGGRDQSLPAKSGDFGRCSLYDTTECTFAGSVPVPLPLRTEDSAGREGGMTGGDRDDAPLARTGLGRVRGQSRDVGPGRAARCKGFARTVGAGAARGGNAEIVLQFIETGAAVTDGVGDVAVGYPVADANDHGSSVTRMVRICKRCHSSRPAAFRGLQPPASGADLRLQVVLLADLGDQLELGLEEIDVLLGVVEDVA